MNVKNNKFGGFCCEKRQKVRESAPLYTTNLLVKEDLYFAI